MKKLLILFVSLISDSLAGQNLFNRDSLLRVYASAVPRDTSYVNLLNQLCKAYRLAVPDSAIAFGNEANWLAEKIFYKKGISNSLNLIGTCYFYKGDFPTTHQYQQRSLEYAKAHHLKIQYTKALNSLALAYQYQGNYFAAFESYLEALDLEEKSKNYNELAKVLANIGLLWKNEGNYDNSITYSKRALSLADSIPPKQARYLKSSVYSTLGNIFTEQKKFNEALQYLQQSLQLNEDLGNKMNVASCLLSIGWCYLSMNQLTLAEDYLKHSLKQSKDLHNNGVTEMSLIDLADIYLRKHKPLEALPLTKESLELSQKNNNKEHIRMNYQQLASEYKELGRLALACDYLAKAIVLGDSLKNADLTKKISDLQGSYELNRKESEIRLLEKDATLKKAALNEEKNLRYGLIGLVAGLCVFVGIVYYSFSLKASL